VGQTGNIGGYAVADVLTGKNVPSGKLSDTWAASYNDYPSAATFSHNNGNLDDEYYTEGIYVGYRYFDTFNIAPNYCFGYGLSYTNFNIEVYDITADETQISVSVKVKNVGNINFGKEVVQIYYSAPTGKLDKPYQELVAFGKTKLLAPGEEQNMKISFKTASMASYSEATASWVLEAGDYLIRVGNSSRNTKVAAVIVVDQEVVTEKLANLFKDTESFELIKTTENSMYTYEGEKEEIAAAKRISINTSEMKTVAAEYQEEKNIYKDTKPEHKITMEDVLEGRATLEELTAQLTIEEMATLCVGTMRMGASAENIIGSASASVPGAAGDTTSLMIDDRRINNLILADGPAGLRLIPHFQTTLDGTFIPGGEVFSNMPSAELTQSEEKIDYYQYCTAVPIAWMLAQSWDVELIEKIGEIVGREMQEFHVTLWLAPGMNIHRNPLCGRNFEYYSEDPLLTGMCAAADTKGVQSYPGIGTTIKHFAANSQEDNRMFTNAHISERTLREIYLKGFEIAIKSVQPMSIMTSYNLLNGVHTANSYDLLTSVTRDEWGFEGFVMTDWFTSQDTSFLFGEAEHKYPISSSPLCIKVGNDLQMPGCQKNIDDIIEAVKEGTLTLGELQYCAINILRVTMRSDYYEGIRPYTAEFDNLCWYVKVE
jgi:beta-glucosidase